MKKAGEAIGEPVDLQRDSPAELRRKAQARSTVTTPRRVPKPKPIDGDRETGKPKPSLLAAFGQVVAFSPTAAKRYIAEIPTKPSASPTPPTWCAGSSLPCARSPSPSRRPPQSPMPLPSGRGDRGPAGGAGRDPKNWRDQAVSCASLAQQLRALAGPTQAADPIALMRQLVAAFSHVKARSWARSVEPMARKAVLREMSDLREWLTLFSEELADQIVKDSKAAEALQARQEREEPGAAVAASGGQQQGNGEDEGADGVAHQSMAAGSEADAARSRRSVGTSQPRFSLIEQGKAEPSQEVWQKLLEMQGSGTWDAQASAVLGHSRRDNGFAFLS